MVEHGPQNALGSAVTIKDVCIFLAPFMAANTIVVAYFLGKEVSKGSKGVGLLSAFFIALVPGYTSRSVAGAYDNEAVAIFAMLLTFFLFLRSVTSGRLIDCAYAAAAYFYMASCWGGYIYIINLIPLYVIALVISGMYSNRLWTAYSTFYIFGTLLSMQIPFVGFQPVHTAEHLLAMATFVGLQLFALSLWSREHLQPGAAATLSNALVAAAVTAFASLVLVCFFTGRFPQYTARFLSLIDPTFAAKHLPVIASVSEHQPTTWATFFFDLHILVFLLPLGLYRSCKAPSEANTFLVIFTMTCVYFSGVMLRLILVLAPAACIMSALGLSPSITTYMQQCRGIGGAKRGDIDSKCEPSLSSTCCSCFHLFPLRRQPDRASSLPGFSAHQFSPSQPRRRRSRAHHPSPNDPRRH